VTELANRPASGDNAAVRPHAASRLALAVLGAWALVPGLAAAESYVVQRGETLEHVARARGCTVDELMRANNLRTTLVRAGTTIRLPACTLRARARTRLPDQTKGRAVDAAATDDDKARTALAVIDGASWIARPSGAEAAAPGDGSSQGLPWRGRLLGGRPLPRDEGYRIRRPTRAYGATHVVEHLRGAIAGVRALYPDVHTLAIGDLSAPHGGKLSNHRSHQTGLDVDVGFYFHRVPEGYPDRFVAANAELDLQATWALVTAFARTTHLDDGVEIIFLDHAVQRRLHDWARKRGTPDGDLRALFQYPRDKDAQAGLVRHWPNHADHLHVRFKAGGR
jgi:murein endopeptidase